MQDAIDQLRDKLKQREIFLGSVWPPQVSARMAPAKYIYARHVAQKQPLIIFWAHNLNFLLTFHISKSMLFNLVSICYNFSCFNSVRDYDKL